MHIGMFLCVRYSRTKLFGKQKAERQSFQRPTGYYASHETAPVQNIHQDEKLPTYGYKTWRVQYSNSNKAIRTSSARKKLARHPLLAPPHALFSPIDDSTCRRLRTRERHESLEKKSAVVVSPTIRRATPRVVGTMIPRRENVRRTPQPGAVSFACKGQQLGEGRRRDLIAQLAVRAGTI